MMILELPGGGVQTLEPPSQFKASIDASVKQFVIDNGSKNGIYTVTTFNKGKLGTGLVIVKNAGKHVRIEGYIGKVWGEPVEGGIKSAWLFD